MAKEEIKKGKVFIQTTTGNIVSFSELQKAEMKKSSQQVKEDKKLWGSGDGLVKPPYPPDSFLTLYESNAIFWRCVNQLATDVAGLGWSLQLLEEKKENKIELKRITDFLKKPNVEGEYFRTILKQLLVDWGTVGWFGMEVVRSNKGEIAEIYHVPAHTFRIHKSKEKFCQSRNNKKIWFKKFGLEKNIDPKTGKKGQFTIKKRANELIYYKNYYPRSDFYGVPNILAAIGEVMGLIGIRDYNLSFFDNYGIPSAIIVLEGDWEDDSPTKIQEFIANEIKGTENAHKTLVVKTPEDCKFTYTPLKTEVKEGAFRLYEQTRRDNILIAYSMPPERIGVRVTGSLGSNVAAEATKIYVQGVVEPLQLDLESIINQDLIQSEIYEFKFNDIDLRDLNDEVDRLVKLMEHAAKTPNEVRNDMGLKPYLDGDKFYMASSLIEIGEPGEEDGLHED